MINDKYLTRLVGWTVCILAGLSVAAAIYQAVVQHKKVDSELHDLVILLAGGILTAFRTGHAPGESDAPVAVKTAPGDTVATEPAHPDAPQESDL